MEMLANAVVVIIFQYVSLPNHHMYTLNTYVTCQLYLNKTGKNYQM